MLHKENQCPSKANANEVTISLISDRTECAAKISVSNPTQELVRRETQYFRSAVIARVKIDFNHSWEE